MGRFKSSSLGYLDTPIEFLKGVGPQKGELLNKELNIFSFGDLLWSFPFRYIDKTQIHPISSLNPEEGYFQIKGILSSLQVLGSPRKKRMVGRLKDDSGSVELIWFKGVHFLQRTLQPGQTYIAYGKPSEFRGKVNIAHPEMELFIPGKGKERSALAPVYSSTEKLNTRGLDAKARRRLIETLLANLPTHVITENLPDYLLERTKLIGRFKALTKIHFPKSDKELTEARNRLKFEELFFLQLRLLEQKVDRQKQIKGLKFDTVGTFFNQFYHKKLQFELTDAQKRVIKEIRTDLGYGIQMNRLLQGDVGSGKTVVALMCMLISLDNGYQAVMMAPTEILATQHYNSLREMVAGLGLKIAFLSGNVKGKKRKELLKFLEQGDIDILVGTHAIIEDPVVFKNLGLAITDEQHRFGVKQRAKLWAKGKDIPPHILVMTATPIPRTLAMTLYGDLDISVIDELPPGRKEIITKHWYESSRLKLFGFLKKEIAKGRQVYVVYPLIEESEKLDLANLYQGYEAMQRDFPPDQYQMSIVHGRMKAADKEFEMQRFLKGETQIMVATTVIEVGVNVPNATVMVIENAERFGLSQLHQLRGRVGRGGDQSYCLLMTGFKLSEDSKVRLATMVRTNNGFEISEVDLKLRGQGSFEGTQQSGVPELHISDLR
ncbi:MAG: ATP-dependent DNA helicase RecG, partial [Saprospiraceae bacterium]|nr:ATP-dependent DNA helicase RecG [Saprospiraceae bacterium]